MICSIEAIQELIGMILECMTKTGINWNDISVLSQYRYQLE